MGVKCSAGNKRLLGFKKLMCMYYVLAKGFKKLMCMYYVLAKGFKKLISLE